MKPKPDEGLADLRSSSTRAIDDLRWWVVGKDVHPLPSDLEELMNAVHHTPASLLTAAMTTRLEPHISPPLSLFHALLDSLSQVLKEVDAPNDDAKMELLKTAWTKFVEQVSDSASGSPSFSDSETVVVRRVLDGWLEVLLRTGRRTTVPGAVFPQLGRF